MATGDKISGKHQIDVTADDIEHGEANNCHKCPAARALMRTFDITNPNEVSVGGDPDAIRVCDQLFKIPIELSQFMFDFDMGNPVEPLSFSIDADKPYVSDDDDDDDLWDEDDEDDFDDDEDDEDDEDGTATQEEGTPHA